jgi:hypothetical protein
MPRELSDLVFAADLCQAAREAAEAGYFVFPLTPRTKVPLKGSEGFKDASADPDKATVGWVMEPKANIGWAPEPTGCCVVDIDGAEGEGEWSELQAEHGAATDTMTIGTPSGGRHLVFAGSLPSTIGKLAPHVDSRGVGGFGLLPPSYLDPYRKKGKDIPGGEYTWLSAEGMEPAPVPEWIAPLLAKPEPSAPSPAAGNPVTPTQLREMLSFIQPPEGRGDWLPVALALQHGQIPLTEDWSPDEWRALQHEWSCGGLWRQRTGDSAFVVESYDEDGNDATLGDRGRENAIAGIGSIIALANKGGYTGRIDGRPIEEIFPNAAAGLGAGKPAYRFQLRDEATQDAAPDIVPLIEDFLPDGGTACIHGPLGSYKSFVATEIAFAVASGLPCFGKLPVRRSGPVIYLVGEGATGIEKRRRPALRHAYGITRPLPFYTVKAVPLTREGSEAMQACADDIRAQLGPDVHPALVILDTKTVAMAGLNEDKAGDAQLYVEGAALIAEQLKCLMLTIAHEGLVTGRMRGSTAAPAGIENNWTIENDTDHRVACLKPSRLKDDDLDPIYLQGRPVDVPALPKPGMVFDVITREEYQRVTGKGGDKREGGVLTEREDIRQALGACGLIHPKEATTTAFVEMWIDAELSDEGGYPPRTDDARAERAARIDRKVRWLENRSTPPTNKRAKPAAGFYRMETEAEARAAGRRKPAKMWSVPADEAAEGGSPA